MDFDNCTHCKCWNEANENVCCYCGKIREGKTYDDLTNQEKTSFETSKITQTLLKMNKKPTEEERIENTLRVIDIFQKIKPPLTPPLSNFLSYTENDDGKASLTNFVIVEEFNLATGTLKQDVFPLSEHRFKISTKNARYDLGLRMLAFAMFLFEREGHELSEHELRRAKAMMMEEKDKSNNVENKAYIVFGVKSQAQHEGRTNPERN